MATAILENGVRCCSQVAAETTARHHEEPPRGKYGARVALSRVMGSQMQGRFSMRPKSAWESGPGKRWGNPRGLGLPKEAEAFPGNEAAGNG